jgi:uncharacterized Tic20 family protein
MDMSMDQPTVDDRQVRQWAMILHLSLLAGYVIPLAGLVAPIIIWQLKRDEMPGLDAHGRVVANWIVSSIIYLGISLVLIFVVIGIPLIMLLGVVGVVFPIIGGIKANDGILWKYPMSIAFFR